MKKQETISAMELNFTSAEEADNFDEGGYYLLKTIAIGVKFIVENWEDDNAAKG